MLSPAGVMKLPEILSDFAKRRTDMPQQARQRFTTPRPSDSFELLGIGPGSHARPGNPRCDALRRGLGKAACARAKPADVTPSVPDVGSHAERGNQSTARKIDLNSSYRILTNRTGPDRIHRPMSLLRILVCPFEDSFDGSVANAAVLNSGPRLNFICKPWRAAACRRFSR
jgi:hypothetical protein